MSKFKVKVLLSIYKPDHCYLKEQLESLSNQQGVDLYLSTRVDDIECSEETLAILRSYANRFSGFELNVEHNVGAAVSFCELVRSNKGSCEYDFYAFCDQDDFWAPTKLLAAIDKIGVVNVPIYYCSTLNVCDSNLNIIHKTSVPQYISFANSLAENIVTGCTVVMNKSAFQEFANYIPKTVTMHDHWVYMLSMVTGNLIYDDDSYIFYRQHDNNVVGSTYSAYYYLSKLKVFIKSFSSPKERGLGQINEFYEAHMHHMNDEKKELIDIYNKASSSNFKSKLKLMNICRRNGFLERFIFSTKVLLGKL